MMTLSTRQSVRQAHQARQNSMQIVVHTQMLGITALAAMHGTTDFASPPVTLTPYIGLVLWPASISVTPFFLCASIVHFGRDIGVRGSLGLHGALVLAGLTYHQDEAFAAFVAYFCAVHTPLHYLRHAHAWRFPLVATLLCALLLQCLQPLPTEIVLSEWMQRLVVAHILSDEWSNLITGTSSKETIELDSYESSGS